MIADERMWVKVEFYGQLPTQQVVTAIDYASICTMLMKTFGFEAIASLSVVRELGDVYEDRES